MLEFTKKNQTNQAFNATDLYLNIVIQNKIWSIQEIALNVLYLTEFICFN